MLRTVAILDHPVEWIELQGPAAAVACVVMGNRDFSQALQWFVVSDDCERDCLEVVL